MAKSIKFTKNTYFDTNGITHGVALLSTILDFQDFNERYVGKWHDGRSIYRKICRFTPDNEREYNYYHGVSGIVEILPMSCAILHRIDGQYVPFSLYYPTGDSKAWGIGLQFTKSRIVTWLGLNMFNQMDTSSPSIVAIMYYTK